MPKPAPCFFHVHDARLHERCEQCRRAYGGFTRHAIVGRRSSRNSRVSPKDRYGTTRSARDLLRDPERAEAVKRYLYEQHQLPLHEMDVIRYGEEKPALPNNTREGRARNRRVVVRILT